MSTPHDALDLLSDVMRAELAVCRRRYECTCGFHGCREQHSPPPHIKCPRCGGIAVATGQPELVK